METVILVNPDFSEPRRCFPLPLSVLAAELLGAGFDVVVADLDGIRDEDAARGRLADAFDGRDVVLVGVTGMVTTFRSVGWVIDAVRRLAPDVPVVVGGSLAVTAPSALLDRLGPDYLILGDGELPIVKLAEAVCGRCAIGTVPNLSVRTGSGWRPPAMPPWSASLENAPMPAYRLFDPPAYVRSPDYAHFDVFSGRGCVMNCNFCYKMSGSAVRKKPPEAMLDEFAFLEANWGLNRFNFVDDNFGLSPKWIQAFIEARARRGMTFAWRFQASVNTFRSRDVIRAMKDNGLSGVSMGIESGSQEIQTAMGKGIKIDHARKVMDWFGEVGIPVSASFILGFPEENDRTVAETVRFIRESDLTNVTAFFLTPYPGTAIYETAKSTGRIADEVRYIEGLENQFMLSVNMTDLPDTRLIEMRDEIMAAAGDSETRKMKQRMAAGGRP